MRYSGPGQIPSLKGLASNKIHLPSGGTYTLYPAGDYLVRTGLYNVIQQFDPISGLWVRIGGGVAAGGVEYVLSDGVNYRIANQTGCLVGALITNAGSGYTSAPVVTASAGGSLWRAFVGGAVNTSVTISNGGTGYTYPPICVISAPPNILNGGGIQASATCTISGGAVNAVTISNQGAGYPSAPTITFINDPRENPNVAVPGSTVTYGGGATAVLTLTGSGTITGLVCADHGQGGLTSLPTLAFSGGGGSSAAATGIMCWTVTAGTVGTAGAGLSAQAFARATGEDNFPTTSPAYTNPSTQAALVVTRSADVRYTVTAGAIATPVNVIDGGIYTSVPTTLVLASASIVTTAPVATFAMGGLSSEAYIQQM